MIWPVNRAVNICKHLWMTVRIYDSIKLHPSSAASILYIYIYIYIYIFIYIYVCVCVCVCVWWIRGTKEIEIGKKRWEKREGKIERIKRQISKQRRWERNKMAERVEKKEDLFHLPPHTHTLSHTHTHTHTHIYIYICFMAYQLLPAIWCQVLLIHMYILNIYNL